MCFGDDTQTNPDCQKCCYKAMIQDGGDYEEIVPYCIKHENRLTYIKAKEKLCKLKEGSFFKAIEVSED